MRTGRPRLQITERIKAHSTSNSTGCWLWGGVVNQYGYGQMMVTVEKNKRVTRGAHRESYKAFVGPIPDGLHLDHLCRVRHCVNPRHLEPVTCMENVRRGVAGMAARTRQLAKTHCPKGHPYDETNTYFRSNGWRMCAACNAAWCKRYQERRQAALP